MQMFSRRPYFVAKRCRRPRRNTAAGFTLVDVLVGTALMLIVFLGLGALLRADLAVASLARATNASYGLAESRLEYVRGLSYDALAIGTESATTTQDGASYGVRTTIAYGDDTDTFKKAQVEVTTYGTRAHTLVLVSSFAP